jgi:hypothetical protein
VVTSDLGGQWFTKTASNASPRWVTAVVETDGPLFEQGEAEEDA